MPFYDDDGNIGKKNEPGDRVQTPVVVVCHVVLNPKEEIQKEVRSSKGCVRECAVRCECVFDEAVRRV